MQNQNGQAYQFELMALRVIYPNATPNRLKKLWKLAHDKGVKIIEMPRSSEALDNLMCSIVRHDDTHYDFLLYNRVSRESARGIISPAVKSILEKLKRRA